QEFLLAVGGRGGDAVDHAIGEGDVGPDPFGEGRVDQRGEADDGVFGDVTVAGDVVAAHDGERLNAGVAAFDEAGEDQAEGGFRRCEVCGVVGDVGMGRIEFLGCRVDVVAALGDGQRDDAD